MLLRPIKSPRPNLPLEALEDRLLLHGDAHQEEGAELASQSSEDSGDNPETLAETPVTGAKISGTVFGDLTLNGLSADDPRLASITVELFRDDGDGIFGNDTLLGSDQTDVSGRYEFTDLSAGTYFLRQSAANGYIDNPTTRLAKVIIPDAQIPGTQIDSFDTAEQLAFVNGVQGTKDSSVVGALGAIGTERDFSVEVTSAAGLLLLTSSGGKLNFGTGSDATGTYVVTWDGADGDAETLDPTGLGGIDLTGNGASTGFRFKAGADHDGATLELRIYTDATHWSKAIITLPNTGGLATADVTVSFDEFVAGGAEAADFASVGALQIRIDASDGLDVQVDQIEAFGAPNQTHDFPNETLPTLTVNDITVTEGDVGTVNAVFTLTLSKASTMPVVVTYGTVDGPAVVTADYLATAGLVTFAPGTITAKVTVPVVGDLLPEPTETFSLHLSALSGATFSRSIGVATVLDGDVTPPVTPPAFFLYFSPTPYAPGPNPGVPLTNLGPFGPATTFTTSNGVPRTLSADAYGSGGDSNEEELGSINMDARLKDALDEVLAGFADFRPRRSTIGEEVTGLLMNLADADQPHLLSSDAGDEVLHQPTVRKLQKRDAVVIPPDDAGVIDDVLGMSRYWWLLGLPMGGLVGRAAWLYRDRAGQVLRNFRRPAVPKQT